MGRNEKDTEISELSGQATQLYNDKEWDKAIECLRKVRVLLKENTTIYPIATWLRLPIFLQQAGRFEEAMQEFEKLLGEVDAMAARNFGHQPDFIQEMFAVLDKSVIYDKMRLACKRQKLVEEAKKYEDLSNQYENKRAKLSVKAEQYREKESAEFRKKYKLK